MASRKVLALIKQARAGVPEAQRELAVLYLRGGEGLAANPRAAASWLLRAAQAGDGEALLLLGDACSLDLFEQPEVALPWLARAAQAGSVPARLALAGACAQRGEQAAALDWLRPAVAARVPEALRMFALLSDAQAETPDALALLAEAAEAGDRAAGEALVDRLWRQDDCDLWRPGLVPGEGEWPTGDPALIARALDWHVRLWPLMASTPPERAYQRGVLLLRLHRRESLAWLESAQVRGVVRAAYLLGLLHVGPSYVGGLAPAGEGPRGRWLPRSYKKAARYLEAAAAACAGGFAEAEMALAVLYCVRGFVQRDVAVARRHLERAALLGHGPAQFRYAAALLKQDGQEVEAAYWLRQAVASGVSGADAALTALVAKVPADDPLRLARAAAAEKMLPVHPALARRMTLAACFGLRRHEWLLLDVLAADRGEVLLVDVQAGFRNARRRLVAVQDDGQREAISRARLLVLNEVADVQGDHAQRLRQFRACCRKAGVEGALFEP